MIAAALAIAASAAAGTARAIPNPAQVRDAVGYALNSLCDGGVESDTCVSHPSSVAVRGVRCAAGGPAMANCRYERRVRSTGRRPRWSPAETRFAYDGARRAWSVDVDFPLTPDRADVEGALQWQSGHACRILIDACIDQDGNEMYVTPEFTVSALECRPVAERRASCSFTSARSYGSNSARPSERCTGTLQRRDHEGGETSWTFFFPDPMRRPYAALLSCN
jgi:hypothetical protein